MTIVCSGNAFINVDTVDSSVANKFNFTDGNETIVVIAAVAISMTVMNIVQTLVDVSASLIKSISDITIVAGAKVAAFDVRADR